MGIWQPTPELERSSRSLVPAVRSAIRDDARRIVIVGAGGWIGRATVAMLHAALGPDETRKRVICFGSRAGSLAIGPDIILPQSPLSELGQLPGEPTLLFHLAFLTKDKVGGINDDEYARTNRDISAQVLAALAPIGADRLFVASSGAAAFADDPAAAHDLRLYGGLKRDDEALFANWANEAGSTNRALITRIYNISGPYINKHQTYALASFILDALNERPIEVRAPMAVFRGYIAMRELVSLIFAVLLAESGEPVLQFDTGGEALELARVAQRVTEVLGGGAVARRPITELQENCYLGDDKRYRILIERFGIEHVPLAQQIAETAAYLALDR